jgi:hypothetical protein
MTRYHVLCHDCLAEQVVGTEAEADEWLANHTATTDHSVSGKEVEAPQSHTDPDNTP